jgi:hypothetical protein
MRPFTRAGHCEDGWCKCGWSGPVGGPAGMMAHPPPARPSRDSYTDQVRRTLGVFLLVLGGLGLGIAAVVWGEWSYLGELIAWMALVWGLMFLSWGLTITWLGRPLAGLLGAGTGAASSLIAVLRGMRHPQFSGLTFPVVVAGAVAALAGLLSFGIGRRKASKPPANDRR